MMIISTTKPTSRIAQKVLLAIPLAMFLMSGELRAGETVAPIAGPVPEAAHIRRLIDEEHYAGAEAAARRFLAAETSRSGDCSMQAAEATDLLVEVFWRFDRSYLDEAPTLAKQAVAVKEKLLGPKAIELATSLDNLSHVLLDRGESEAARVVAERALRVSEANLPPDDPGIVRGLLRLGRVLATTGLVAESEILMRRSVSIREADPGTTGMDLFDALYGLGVTLTLADKFSEAEMVLRRALEIGMREGPHGIRTISTRCWLGDLLFEMGRYTEALSYKRDCVAEKERIYDQASPDVAWNLVSLAGTYWKTGNLEAAQKALMRSISILESIFGPTSTDLAANYANLGVLRMTVGDYDGALAAYEHARSLAARSGSYEDQVLASHNLGELLFLEGKYGQARLAYEEALRVEESKLPDLTALRASTLDSLARLLAQSGDYTAALSWSDRTLELRERTLGSDHPHYADSLNARARMELARGAADAAFRRALQAETIAARHFRRTAAGLTERESLLFERVRISGFDVALSALKGMDPPNPRAAAEALDAVIRSRALVLDATASRHHELLDTADPELADLIAQLRRARRHLAQIATSGDAGDDREEFRARIAGAEETATGIERTLAGRSEAIRLERDRSVAGLTEVRRALPPRSALVAYMRYESMGIPGYAFDFTPREETIAGPGATAGAGRYAAFVLRSHRDAVSAVFLPEEDIDALAGAWRETVAREPGGLDTADSRAERRCRAAGEPLRRAVWDPIIEHLGQPDRVFIVPDGALQLVSFGALPAGDDRYLVEEGPTFHYLSAERDLLHRRDSAESARDLLVLGAPDFEAGEAQRIAGGAQATGAPVNGNPLTSQSRGGQPSGETAARPVYRGPTSRCSSFRSLRFDPLPGARQESQSVAALWRSGRAGTAGTGVVVLTGEQATEDAFKAQAPRFGAVHLATHAFFLDGNCDLKPSPEGGKAAEEIPADHPLLLSGLALAGANRRERAEKMSDREDGILTGEEIAAMDLTGVAWVVLSACETGGGVVRSGEGVLGLRRAFEVAGAGTLIMSLWPVDDRSTLEWMKALYAHRLAENMPAAEAIRASDLAQLARRRRSGLSTHPYYWAPFVATGDWR